MHLERACAVHCRWRKGTDNFLSLLASVAVTAILQFSTADAIVINGSSMSMDQAIMAASQSTKMFRLMDDANVVRVELDMLYHTDVWESMMKERENGTRRHRRKVIRDQRFRWPNAEVPYQMAVAFSSAEMQQFNDALADYHRYTCIRFRQAVQTDRDYVRVVDGGGCSSFVGRSGGEQRLSLAVGCRYKGIIIHELGHAVGFQHEQTRFDRDNYVYIAEENIDSFMLYNFQKYTPAQMDNFNVPYDYLSVMHYGEYAFSRNGQRSIRTRDPSYQSRIGNRGGFSFRDIKAANLMYSCASRSGCPLRACPGEGFVARDCTCWCPSGNEARPVTQCVDATTRPGVQPTTQAPTATDLQTRQRQRTLAATSTTPSIATALTTTTAKSRQCYDANNMCPWWAERGECRENPQYMLTHCAASCRTCSVGGGVQATTRSPGCRNMDEHCDYWQRQNYCRSPLYSIYMQLNCPLACGACSPPAASAATVRQRSTNVAITRTTLRRVMTPATTMRRPAATTMTLGVRQTLASATRVAYSADDSGRGRQGQRQVDRRVSGRHHHHERHQRQLFEINHR